MSKPFDLIILGGGPAGYSAAIKGALQGFSVALVEKSRVGGACINRGCIPTKALWGTALQLTRIQHFESHGIKFDGKISFDFAQAVERQYAIIDQMVANIQERMKKLGVVTFQAEGRVEKQEAAAGKQTLFTVSLKGHSQAQIQSRFVLIGTGSRPSESPVLKSDHKLVLNTDDFVTLKQLPKRIAIVGGGVVACEFASILNKFGVEVHLLEHSTQVLSAMDPEVVSLLMKRFELNGINLHLQTKVTELVKAATSVTMKLTTDSKPNDLEVDSVLIAIGRLPNSEGMNLENIGVKFTPRGHIMVNEKNETDCPGLYAAGDVVGGQMLAHKAWYDASIAIRSMCGEECKTNYDTVPGAIFTIPEMASVGLQPDQARQKGYNVAIGKYKYSENAQAMCMGHTDGMVKAVIDRDTGKVLGCTMMGHNAGNLISEVALALHTGLSAKDISDTIHPHPTLSEMIWESFLDTQGLSVHKGS